MKIKVYRNSLYVWTFPNIKQARQWTKEHSKETRYYANYCWDVIIEESEVYPTGVYSFRRG